MSGQPADINSAPHFVDGFGTRYLTLDPEAGDAVEVLAFDPALVDAPDFASTLGTRVARLAGARHTVFARVRRIDRPTTDALLLISDRVSGWRLAQVLDTLEREPLPLDISAVLSLLRQLIPAIALFARHQRDLAIGTVGPEHLILTPQGRLVVTEYVLGPAVEKLSLPRERLWRSYRVAVANADGITRFSPRTDAFGIGLVVLALLLGRRLRDDEFPGALSPLLQAATETSGGLQRPLSSGLTNWLTRALQLDARTAFQSPHDAQVAFEEMLATERGYVTTPALLESFLTRFAALAGAPPDPPRPAVMTAAEQLFAAASASPAPPSPPEPELGAIEIEPIPVELSEATDFSQPAPEAPGEASAAIEDREPEIEQRPVARPIERPHPAPVELPRVEQPSVAAPAAGEARSWMPKAFAAAAVLALIEAGVIVWLWDGPSGSLARDGELVVQSLPGAARVTLDDGSGEDRDLGATPVTVRLSPGTYSVKVYGPNGQPRVIPIQIRAGVQTAQYLELQSGR